METPTPDEIRAAREAAGHTAEQAIAVLHRDRRMTWVDWEAGRREMPAGLWELYLLRTGRHPTHMIVRRHEDRCGSAQN